MDIQNQPNGMLLSFDVELLVLSEIDVLEAARNYGKPCETIEESLLSMAVNPQETPEVAGFRIEPQTAVEYNAESKLAQLHIRATVIDLGKLLTEASEVYRSCWAGEISDDQFVEGDSQSTVAKVALYEILIASNNSPNPGDCGFNIVKDDIRQDVASPRVKSTMGLR